MSPAPRQHPAAEQTNLSLRIPAALYRKLRKVAERERRSVTQTVAVAVEEYVNRAESSRKE